MQKDYTAWHAYKTRLQVILKAIIPYFSERDIWWCSLGLNIGDEEDGKGEMFERPVLIVHKFNKNLFIGIPLTSKVKEGKFYFSVTSGGLPAAIILSQIRVLDARRLRRRIDTVSEEEMVEIKDKLGTLLTIL